MAARTSKTPSLSEFTENYKATQKTFGRARYCFTCELPEEVYKQIAEARANRVTVKTILQWLYAIGYEDATRSRVERHFQDNHERP